MVVGTSVNWFRWCKEAQDRQAARTTIVKGNTRNSGVYECYYRFKIRVSIN